MTNSSFQVSIDGENVSPETVRLNDLIDLLRDLESALINEAKAAGSDEKDFFISLTSVDGGSDILTLTVDERLRKSASKISQAIASGDISAIHKNTKKSLERIWKKSSSRNWSVSFVANEKIASATISPDTTLFLPHVVHGSTELLVKVLRVGGTPKPTALVKPANSGKITIDLPNEEMAKTLGTRLYQVVAIRGEATWRTDDWQIIAFKAIALGIYDDAKHDAISAFQDLADAAGNHWDNIDPESYVRNLRGDE